MLLQAALGHILPRVFSLVEQPLLSEMSYVLILPNRFVNHLMTKARGQQPAQEVSTFGWLTMALLAVLRATTTSVGL